jgi:hypothetical protein
MCTWLAWRRLQLALVPVSMRALVLQNGCGGSAARQSPEARRLLPAPPEGWIQGTRPYSISAMIFSVASWYRLALSGKSCGNLSPCAHLRGGRAKPSLLPVPPVTEPAPPLPPPFSGSRARRFRPDGERWGSRVCRP